MAIDYDTIIEVARKKRDGIGTEISKLAFACIAEVFAEAKAIEAKKESEK
jgi:hypothetical protein